MSILTRFAAVLIVGGLITGLVLRVVLKRRRLRSLMLLGMLPWLVHAAVVLLRTRADGAPVVGALVFAGAGLAVALVGAWMGWRAADRRPFLTAVMPLVVTVVYGLLPFGLYVWWLHRWSIRVDALTTVAYVWASLFASAALLVLAPRPPMSSWRWPRRRR